MINGLPSISVSMGLHITSPTCKRPVCNNVHDSKETVKTVLPMKRILCSTNTFLLSLETCSDPLQCKVLLRICFHAHHPIEIPTSHPMYLVEPLDLHVRSRLHSLHQIRHESHQHGNKLQRVLIPLQLILFSFSNVFRLFQLSHKCIHDLRDLALFHSLLHHEQQHRLPPIPPPFSPSPPH